MKVIKPVAIGRGQLISSSVPEEEYDTFDIKRDYKIGDRVQHESAVFECVQTPNIGHVPGQSPLYWATAGPVNRWAMFDNEVSTQTTGENFIKVVLRPGLVNSLALLELHATSITVVGREGLSGPVIYEAHKQLEGSVVTNWYEYFFEPFSRITELVVTDLPAYGNLHLEVTISAPGAQAACGALICGSAYFIGDAEYGGSAGIIDYSRKETSATGVTTFRRRRYSRRMSQRLWIDSARLGAVYRLLSGLRATPCVWIGADVDGYGLLTIYGFYRDFSIDIEYPMVKFCNLEIEGLT
ncbi:hypothetical protein ACLQ9F_11895 [Bordetella avium]|uniref:Phage protein n=1 Tax=Bordetella avium (strain 197N) TaxID=360910 RepID=Q2L293_BORA1|nr:hypothetical protein [Bordetella avium]AZY48860.1 hypothetical protein C0J09_06695 [Bordetella avium]AZY52240.1 hypothetical protein C0J07_06765 [Bordetella avium]RIQ47781.1 hypothetical protein D0843_16620 [Bordetella avium]RIQ71049.1 hypothetical protein D0838_10015 [Bordetella avium]CAJ49086.1 putative phage protein [Bordetella avium 197N]